MNDPRFYSKNLEEEQSKSKVNRSKEIIKIQAETNKLENRQN